MTCESVNIELCKKNCRNGITEKSLYSYDIENGEEMFVNAISDYIRLSGSDSEFPNSSVGTPPELDSVGVFNYNGNVITINIPVNPATQATATFNATPATPVTLDQLTVVDGTTTLTIDVTRSPAAFTIIFDNSSGDDYIFDSSVGQITIF